METKNPIAPHETFDLHELITLKTISATKSSVMGGLIKDVELKSIFQQDLITSQSQIKELQILLQSSVLTSSNTDMNNCKLYKATEH